MCIIPLIKCTKTQCLTITHFNSRPARISYQHSSVLPSASVIFQLALKFQTDTALMAESHLIIHAFSELIWD